MNKYKAIFQRSRLVVTTAVFACLGILLGAGVWASAHTWISTKKYSKQIEPYSTNKTNTLRVIKIKRSFKGPLPVVEVTLLNSSTKSITGYILSVGSLNILSDCAASSRGPLAPNETYVEIIPIDNFDDAAAKDPEHTGELVVSAVTFDDQSSEGLSQHIAMIKNKHAGMREQIKLVLPILRFLLNSQESDPEKALLKIETQASLLSTEVENTNLAPDHKNGRAWVQENLDAKIKNLKIKQKGLAKFNYKDGLKEIVAFYEQFLARL
ncbi:MAG: hypothetical protein WCB68_18210 [Pyrinomonadaceae bacterium]